MSQGRHQDTTLFRIARGQSFQISKRQPRHMTPTGKSWKKCEKHSKSPTFNAWSALTLNTLEKPLIKAENNTSKFSLIRAIMKNKMSLFRKSILAIDITFLVFCFVLHCSLAANVGRGNNNGLSTNVSSLGSSTGNSITINFPQYHQTIAPEPEHHNHSFINAAGMVQSNCDYESTLFTMCIGNNGGVNMLNCGACYTDAIRENFGSPMGNVSATTPYSCQQIYFLSCNIIQQCEPVCGALTCSQNFEQMILCAVYLHEAEFVSNLSQATCNFDNTLCGNVPLFGNTGMALSGGRMRSNYDRNVAMLTAGLIVVGWMGLVF